MKNNFWLYGEQTKLAKTSGVQPKVVNDLVHRTRNVSYARAKALADASKEVLGDDRRIDWTHWIENKTTKHPAFFGEPTS